MNNEPKKEDMTLLDWFAGMALAGINANPENSNLRQKDYALLAYDDAASMIEHRKWLRGEE